METPKVKDLSNEGIKLGFGALGLFAGKTVDSFIPQINPIVNDYVIPTVGALGVGYAATKVKNSIVSAVMLGFAMFMGAKAVSNVVAALPFVPEEYKSQWKLSGTPGMYSNLLGMGNAMEEIVVSDYAAPAAAPSEIRLL